MSKNYSDVKPLQYSRPFNLYEHMENSFPLLLGRPGDEGWGGIAFGIICHKVYRHCVLKRRKDQARALGEEIANILGYITNTVFPDNRYSQEDLDEFCEGFYEVFRHWKRANPNPIKDEV